MKITTTIINCHGAMLEVCAFLRPLWPFDLPLDKWPTFCGAGDGIGDIIVPDSLHGCHIAPACFQHDIEFSVCPNTRAAFLAANWRFYRNLRALCVVQTSGIRRIRVEIDCLIYYAAVSTAGRKFFKASAIEKTVCVDPLKHPVVFSKLHRLAKVACLNLPDEVI